MTDVDTSQRGIDRRTLLKRSAAAGAVAWIAPTVVAGPAHAADFIPGTTCTLKCVPQVNLNLHCRHWHGRVSGTAQASPGQEGVSITITSFELTPGSSAACPCGGQPEITAGDGGDIVGQTFVTQFKPGNRLLTFEVPIQVTCEDRSGDKITIACRSQAVARTTGNCNSNAGQHLVCSSWGWAVTTSTPDALRQPLQLPEARQSLVLMREAPARRTLASKSAYPGLTRRSIGTTSQSRSVSSQPSGVAV